MSKPTVAKRLGKRATARIQAIRRRAAEWKRRARRAATLALIAAGTAAVPSFAEAQTGQMAMAPAGGILNRAVGGFQQLNQNGPGYFYYGLNAADRGLGYNGSYMTLGGFIPYSEDDLGGLWSADLRGHFSVNGGFFSNVGLVRKQFLGGSLLGIGVYWDYDGDQNQYPAFGVAGTEFGQFGHSYNQVGVSGEWLTDFGNLRSNGYMPVGTTAYTAGAPNSPFYQNYVMCQYGLDSALSGADLEVGAYIPGLADWAGMISVGGYALGNARYDWSNGPFSHKDVVPWFGGVYTRLDMTFLENWDFSLQANNDSYFDWTGFARLTYRMGGSRRRNVPDQMEQPMMRNEHIVRAHQTPIMALNGDNGSQPWRFIHVDNTAAPGGNGTAERPFNTLAGGNTAAVNPWDVVIVKRGDGTATGYDTRFIFQAPNQFLVGDGQAFYIDTLNCGLKNIASDASGLRPLLSNPTGASIVIDGAVAAGAVVSNFDITGSATGIYATGNLSSGTPRSGPATPITYASATGDTVIMDVTINGTGPGQSGVVIDGGDSGTVPPPGVTPTAVEGAIRFYDTAISDATLFGLQVAGPSSATFELEYNGSIETSAAENIVLVNGMTGGRVGVAVGTAPAGSTIANQVTATGGGGIRLLDNTDTTINIDNVSLTNTSGDAISVQNNTQTASTPTNISAGSGTGINRAASGAAVAISGGAPVFNYVGPITNARATGSVAPSYLLSVQDVSSPADVKLFAPISGPFQDSGDGILVSNAQAGAAVTVSGATIASAGGNGILVSQSSGDLLFRDITITGASVAGVALLENQPGLAATFNNLAISLVGPTATGFLASSSNGAGYAISVLGVNNSIVTASTTNPAVSIEVGPANGAPLLDMQFASITSGVTGGTGDALEFGPGTAGQFTVTGAFTVGGGATPGTAADVTNAGSATVILPP